MAKSRVMKLVAVLAVVAIAGGIILVAVGPAGGAETERYRIMFRLAEFHEIDNNGDGDVNDAGDQETGSFPLKKGGEKVGHLNFICVNSEAHPPRDLCWGTIRISNRGTVTVHGSGPNDANRFIAAITGGTGAYRSASGVMELNFRDPSLTLRID
jgi:hypothetical protein